MSSPLEFRLLPRRRIRLIRQAEVSECGLACLAMIANFHGFRVDLAALRHELAPPIRGTTLRWLMNAAEQMGFSPRAVKLPLDELSHLRMPAVLHWNLNHFVVIEWFRRGKALIHDSGGVSKVYSLDALSSYFTGVALELRPGSEFRPADRRRHLRLSQLWERVSGLKRTAFQIILLSLVIQTFALATPFMLQIALDRVLPAGDYNLMALVGLGFITFSLFYAVSMLLRSSVITAAGISLSFDLTANLARKLFRLPTSWFEARSIGDILSRFQSVTPIQRVLAGGAVGAMLDGVLAVLTLALMFLYSFVLTMIAVAAFLAYLGVRAISFVSERAAKDAVIAAGAREQSTMIESLRGITTLRLANQESSRLAIWQNDLTEFLNGEVRSQQVGNWQSAGNALIFAIENVVSIWVGVHLVLSGQFSVGMLMAFIAYKAQFLVKANPVIDQLVAFRMLRLHLDRLTEIVFTADDVSFERPLVARKLEGRIELSGVHFGYSPGEPVILNGVNLQVSPGEHVAITGPSGCGKSTLVKILLGLAVPTAGEILIDGMPLAQFGHRSYRQEVAAVLQDDHLFSGSLMSNIALFDDQPDMERIVSAARAAAVHEDILAMPMRYETLIGDMGSNLSGGQKQRILLARALYREPKVLIMDEGTSHLDSARETQVSDAIAAMGITRIIVAHRAETLAKADTVYEMANGVLVARADTGAAGGRQASSGPVAEADPGMRAT